MVKKTGSWSFFEDLVPKLELGNQQEQKNQKTPELGNQGHQEPLSRELGNQQCIGSGAFPPGAQAPAWAPIGSGLTQRRGRFTASALIVWFWVAGIALFFLPNAFAESRSSRALPRPAQERIAPKTAGGISAGQEGFLPTGTVEGTPLNGAVQRIRPQLQPPTLGNNANDAAQKSGSQLSPPTFGKNAIQVMAPKGGAIPNQDGAPNATGQQVLAAPEPPKREPNACVEPGDDLAPTMVVIPPGQFLMGSPDSEEGRSANEGPQRWVTIPRPFAMSRCEITVGQFRRFLADNKDYVTTAQRPDSQGCNVWNKDKKTVEWVKEASWDKPGFDQTDDHPVACVSWEDSQAYISWLSQRTGAVYRLPTEAEWEYAARGGTETARYFGEAPQRQCEFANGLGQEGKDIADSSWTLAECPDGWVYTAPVARFRPNLFQLYDMLGNVWEWTEDCWYGTYKNAPPDGSAWGDVEGGDCTIRVVRGGSWLILPQYLRSAYRYRDWTDAANNNLGFRVARAL